MQEKIYSLIRSEDNEGLSVALDGMEPVSTIMPNGINILVEAMEAKLTPPLFRKLIGKLTDKDKLFTPPRRQETALIFALRNTQVNVDPSHIPLGGDLFKDYAEILLETDDCNINFGNDAKGSGLTTALDLAWVLGMAKIAALLLKKGALYNSKKMLEHMSACLAASSLKAAQSFFLEFNTNISNAKIFDPIQFKIQFYRDLINEILGSDFLSLKNKFTQLTSVFSANNDIVLDITATPLVNVLFKKHQAMPEQDTPLICFAIFTYLLKKGLPITAELIETFTANPPYQTVVWHFFKTLGKFLELYTNTTEKRLIKLELLLASAENIRKNLAREGSLPKDRGVAFYTDGSRRTRPASPWDVTSFVSQSPSASLTGHADSVADVSFPESEEPISSLQIIGGINVVADEWDCYANACIALPEIEFDFLDMLSGLELVVGENQTEHVMDIISRKTSGDYFLMIRAHLLSHVLARHEKPTMALPQSASDLKADVKEQKREVKEQKEGKEAKEKSVPSELMKKNQAGIFQLLMDISRMASKITNPELLYEILKLIVLPYHKTYAIAPFYFIAIIHEIESRPTSTMSAARKKIDALLADIPLITPASLEFLWVADIKSAQPASVITSLDDDEVDAARSVGSAAQATFIKQQAQKFNQTILISQARSGSRLFEFHLTDQIGVNDFSAFSHLPAGMEKITMMLLHANQLLKEEREKNRQLVKEQKGPSASRSATGSNSLSSAASPSPQSPSPLVSQSLVVSASASVNVASHSTPAADPVDQSHHAKQFTIGSSSS